MEVSRTFTFDAAHHLTDYHGKCERPHGHTYILTVTVSGKVKKDGLTFDFAKLKKHVDGKILQKLDHIDLNELFKNPSAEHIAVWIWEELKGSLSDVKLSEIRLCETPNTCVIYRGK